jgi:hypothetical protein
LSKLVVFSLGAFSGLRAEYHSTLIKTVPNLIPNQANSQVERSAATKAQSITNHIEHRAHLSQSLTVGYDSHGIFYLIKG